MPKKKAKPVKITLPELTPKESETLDVTIKMLEQNGYMPTRREIAAEIGVSHTLVVSRFRDIASKGYVQLGAKRSQRTMRILFTPGGGEFSYRLI